MKKLYVTLVLGSLIVASGSFSNQAHAFDWMGLLKKAGSFVADAIGIGGKKAPTKAEAPKVNEDLKESIEDLIEVQEELISSKKAERAKEAPEVLEDTEEDLDEMKDATSGTAQKKVKSALKVVKRAKDNPVSSRLKKVLKSLKSVESAL